MPRTFPSLNEGNNWTVSPTERLPETRVPVTTVPNPFMTKTRSIGRRRSPSEALPWTSLANLSKMVISCGMPSSVTEEMGTMGAPCKNVSFTRSLTSSPTSWTNSLSAKSILLTTTKPFLTPSSLQISKCSLVWGIIPSSAATTRATISIPHAPATMCLTNFSCPGTSTIPIFKPLGSTREANPNSMVIPLSFSSFNRSVSMPVSALIRAVLP